MILVFAVALAALSVPACGGSLERLSRLRIKARWAVLAALALQIVVISVLARQMAGWPGQVLELVSYMLAVIFLFANRRIPWLWLVGLGGLSNLVAIGANDGVMPASPVAVRAAGRVLPKGQFLNSAPLLHPRLAFLGDIFSTPRTWPLANVFSAGDVLLAVGALLLLHSVCESRLACSAAGSFHWRAGGRGQGPSAHGYPRLSGQSDAVGDQASDGQHRLSRQLEGRHRGIEGADHRSGMVLPAQDDGLRVGAGLEQADSLVRP